MLSPRVKGEEAAEMMMSSNESLKSDVDDGVCCNEMKFSCIRDDKATKTNWYQQGHGELEALTSKGVLRNFEVFADELIPKAQTFCSRASFLNQVSCLSLTFKFQLLLILLLRQMLRTLVLGQRSTSTFVFSSAMVGKA